jgi:ceramide glucosyltransferase
MLGCGVAILAIAGSVYTGLTIYFVLRFFRRKSGPAPIATETASALVTLLKPLHGDEPALRRNLESFLREARAGRAEIVLGIQDPADPALEAAKSLIARHPDVTIHLSLGDERQGLNGKIANLIGMAQHARGDILVISDSDIEAPPGYLARVVTALEAPGVGVVTCPYIGHGETGFWSRIAAMGLSFQFMPSVITGVSLGMAKPCMGSTIALRRETLEAIGGFEAFRDVLADDYLIGAAVRRLGLRSVVAPVLVSHSSNETSLSELLSHELRWARTVKGVDLPGYAGSLVTHPLPLALVAAALLGFSPAGLAVLALALVIRVLLAMVVNRVAGRSGAPWLLPLRDMLSFAVFVASFFGRAVVWRGRTFHVTADGDLTPAQRP